MKHNLLVFLQHVWFLFGNILIRKRKEKMWLPALSLRSETLFSPIYLKTLQLFWSLMFLYCYHTRVLLRKSWLQQVLACTQCCLNFFICCSRKISKKANVDIKACTKQILMFVVSFHSNKTLSCSSGLDIHVTSSDSLIFKRYFSIRSQD